MKLLTRKPQLAFSTAAHTAPSGVVVRTVDAFGVPAQDLHDAIEHVISTAFDLTIRDKDTLRISWSESRFPSLSTADIVLLPDHIRSAAHAAGLTR